MSLAPAPRPIDNLGGLTTEDGWVVGERIQRAVYQTGGAFSVGYTVSHPDGRSGFMKALDFSRIKQAADQMAALEMLSAAYNFEKNVLTYCSRSRLSKIVTAISDGSFDMTGEPFDKIWYLIFELADSDIRKHAIIANDFDAVWNLRAIQHVAIGISQLHGKGVYHQDVKPSNILVFSSQNTSKLADLGRAHCATLAAPHDNMPLPGVRSYAPPEQLYAFELAERNRARAAADLYALGGLIFFLFTGRMLTPRMIERLRDEHRPPSLSASDGGWTGTFEGVLPYLQSAFAACCDELQEQLLALVRIKNSERELDRLMGIFRQLADPDPLRRGHPATKRLRHANPYGMAQFVSELDRLSRDVELGLRAA